MTNFSEVEDWPIMLNHLIRDYGRSLFYGRRIQKVAKPPMTRAFERGVMAARTGMERDDNPYPCGTLAFGDWKAGYQASVDIADATDLD